MLKFISKFQSFGNVAPSSPLLPASSSQPPVYNLTGTKAMGNISSTSSVFTGLTQTMSNSTTTTSGLLMSG